MEKLKKQLEAQDQKVAQDRPLDILVVRLVAMGTGLLLVAACDKRHNLGDLVRDLRHEGPATLDRFNAGALDQTWYFEALAERNGEPVAVSRSSMLYESGQAEHFGFRANPALLRRLSEATGGRYFEAGDLTGLSDLLRYSSSGITETEYRSVWDAPIVFLLLLSLKAGEWLLRRRWKTI